MDLFALVNAQNRVKTVRTQSDLRYEQYLQKQLQQQQSENIFASNASAQKTTKADQQATSIFDEQAETKKESAFEAVA